MSNRHDTRLGLAGIFFGKFVVVMYLIFAGIFGSVALSVLGGNTVNAQEFDDYIFNMPRPTS